MPTHPLDGAYESNNEGAKVNAGCLSSRSRISSGSSFSLPLLVILVAAVVSLKLAVELVLQVRLPARSCCS